LRRYTSPLIQAGTHLDCSTIIVSYNTFALTEEAVRSALASGAALQHEVIVVDNASPDESALRLRKAFPASEFPDVHIFASPTNLGFAGGNNVGAKHASGRVLFFLNPDTLVRGDTVPRLVAFLDAHPEAGAVGPRVLEADGSDQPSVRSFFSAAELIRHYLPADAIMRRGARRKDPILPYTQPVDIVCGCALAVRRDAFEEVGGWDEAYFMYAEEDEICWALSRTHFVNYFLREAEIVHFGGQSTQHAHADFHVMERRSALQFLRRHGGPGLVALNRVAGAVGFGLRALAFPILARLRPADAEGYRRRGESASALWRWFVFSYR
jgi:N-acetylglucosaminyl-diphospho-decaprenol L-rhamnosyltransferase